jgi:hypothetical protein
VREHPLLELLSPLCSAREYPLLEHLVWKHPFRQGSARESPVWEPFCLTRYYLENQPVRRFAEDWMSTVLALIA